MPSDVLITPASSKVEFTDGSNATKTLRITGTSFSFDSDLGIGITSPNNKLAVLGSASIGSNYNVNGPTNGLIIEGSVGIGTTTPTELLNIRGTDPSVKIDNTTKNYLLQVINSDNRFRIYDNILGVERLTILTGGNVGIGTISPTAKLEVSSTNQIIASFYNNQVSSLTNFGSTGATSFTDLVLKVDNGQAEIFRAGSGYSSYGGTSALNIYNSNGPIAFHSNNTANSMFLSSGGNLGIGTNNPTALLTIYKTAFDSDADGFKFGYSVDYHHSFSSTFSSTTALNNLGININNGFATGRTRVMTLLGNGNVGIGTTTPASLLNIHGTYPQVIINNPTAGSGIQILLRDNGTAAGFIGHFDSTNKLQFSSTNASVAHMTINNVGNVGIGNTSPNNKLAVSGSVSVGSGYNTAAPTNGLIVEGSVGIGITSPNIKLHVVSTSEAARFEGSATWGTAIQITSTATGGRNYQIQSSANAAGEGGGKLLFVDKTAAATRMTIDSGGNVGIGTLSPSGQLHINSTTSGATLIRADGTNGTLFSVVDDLSDSLMSVNNNAGLPVLEVFADDRVVMGQYGQNDFVLVNNKLGLGTNNPAYKLDINGTLNVSGTASLSTVSITGTINSSATEAIRINNNNGFISFYNSAASTRTGYLQGNTGNSVLLASENNALLQFAVGGTVRATISTSGDVGIGTTAPTSQSNYRFLQVNGTNSAVIETMVGNTRIGGFDSDSSNLYVGTIGAFPIVFRTSVNEKWRITNAGVFQSNGAQTIQTSTGNLTLATAAGNGHIILSNHGTGNVGIGTNTPVALLDLYSSASRIKFHRGASYDMSFGMHDATNSALSIKNASDASTLVYFQYDGIVGIGTTSFTYASANRQLVELYGASESLIALRNPTGNLYIQKTSSDVYINNTNSGIMSFATSNAQRMVILASGSVSFGSGSDILGQPGNIFLNGNTGAGNGPALAFGQSDSVTGSIGHRARIIGSGTSQDIFIQSQGASNNVGINANPANAYIYFQTQGNDRVRIQADGNVGIGTVTPSAKLHVVGSSILANNTQINPDSYIGQVVAGNIADGSGWGVSGGIAGNGSANGRSWAIGNSGTDLYFGYQNGSATTTLQTFMQVGGNRNLFLVPVSGNVGIGTTSPTANLTVYNSATPTIDFNTGASTSRGRISATASDFTLAALTSSPLIFKIDSSEKVRIASDGNVGIGITSPSSLLNVSGTGTLGSVFQEKITNGTTTLALGTNATAAEVQSQGSVPLYLNYGGNNVCIVPVGSGNVGIGTTNPIAFLNVVGNGIHSILRNISATSYTSLRLYNDQNNPVRALEIDYSGSSYSGSLVTNGPTGESASIGTTGAYPLALTTNNTARLVISGGGNIGIGVSNPLYTLQHLGSYAQDTGNTANSTGYKIGYYRATASQNVSGGKDFVVNGILSGFMRITIGWANESGCSVARMIIEGNCEVNSSGTGYYFTGYKIVDKYYNNGLYYSLSEIPDVAVTAPINNNSSDKLTLTVRGADTGYTGLYPIVLVELFGNYLTTPLSITAAATTTSTSWLADERYFHTNNTARLFIKSDGNVGIGSITPTQRLTINTGAATNSGAIYPIRLSGGTMTSINDATGIQFIQRDANNDYGGYIRILNTQGNPNYLNPRLEFGVQDTDTNVFGSVTTKMVITGGGSVGIGVTSPNYPIDLQSTTSPLTLNLKLNKSSITNDYAEIAFQLWSGAGSGANTFGGAGTSRPSVVLRALNENGTSAAGAFIVGTFEGGSTNVTLTEKFRIASTGSVGIGANSPATKLHVYSSVAGSGSERTTPVDVLTLETENTTAQEFTGFGQTIVFRGSTYNNTTQRTLGKILHQINDDSVSTTRGTSLDFQLLTNATGSTLASRMYIQYDGNIGINTTSPGSKLDVNGTFRTAINNLTIFNDYIYVSPTENNTLNSAYFTNGIADMWINYAGYNNGNTQFRNFNVGNGKNSVIAWFDGTNKRMSINNGQAASYTLDVNGNANFTNGFYTNTDASSTSYFVGANGTRPIIFQNNTSSAYDFGFKFTDSNTFTIVGGNAAANPTTDLVSFTYNGNVGIGVTSPNNKLHVNGSMSVGSGYNTAAPTDGLIVQGNVGIGISSPLSKLHLVGSHVGGSGFIRLEASDYPIISLKAPGTGDGSAGYWGVRAQDTSNNDLMFYGYRYTSAFSGFWIDPDFGSNIAKGFFVKRSDGNVGIGINTPSSRLHINSTTSGATLLRADGTNGTLFSVVDDLSDSLMSVNNSAGLPVLEVFADDRVVAGQYGANDFILVNNKLGLGTNNPSQKLEVVASSGSSIQALFHAPSGGNSGYLGGIQLGNASSNQNSQIYHNSAGDNTLTFLSNYSGGTANKFVFAPGGTERVRFQQNGNVGLGVQNTNATLHLKPTTLGANGFILERYASTAKLIYMYEYAADGYIEVRSGADVIVSKISGYVSTPTYFQSSVGIGTTSPGATLQVGTGSPTASASGIQFGDDTGARIYRSSSSVISVANSFAASNGYVYASNYLQTGNNLIYPSSQSATQRLEVGNAANNAWIDGLTIAPGGNVTVAGTLTSTGVFTSGYGTFSTPGVTVGDSQYGFYVAGGNLYYKSGSGGVHYWRNIANSANTMSLDNSGNLIVAGTLTESSSIRYKENVKTVSTSILPKLEAIRPVTYNKKDNPNNIEYGVIAEELNELFPELVNKNNNGEVESVNYSRLTVLLIKAVKELKEEVDRLKNK